MASSHTKLDRRDIPWLALIAASFAGGLAFSWQRWGNPLVDCGREMNQPLRLIHGEMLYSSIRHIYGPLSPYINATLYRVFGASLGTLYADGIISALVIVLLVYWLSRHLMGRLGAAAASLSVTWLCTFKQAGNYILPYAYSALHGCLLGLITLALLVRFAELRKKRYLFAAGVAAGITILAKTEMGAAACITGIAATLLVAFPSFGKTVSLGTLFVVPAGAIPLAVYGWIARIVGVTTLSHDSFLLPSYIPEEFIYFNKRMSGLNDPLMSGALIFESSVRFACLALLIVAASILFTRGGRREEPAVSVTVSGAGRASVQQIWILLAAAFVIFAILTVAGGRHWDTGPYIAMPLLLAALFVSAIRRYWKERSTGTSARNLVMILMVVYATASLARIVMRVRSGGAYSAYLIPASVILFVYCWVRALPRLIGPAHPRTLARRIAMGLILGNIVLTAVLISYRYRRTDTFPISTPRGTIYTRRDLGDTFEQAIRFIDDQTVPGQSVAVLPEGTSLDFFTGRRNPLREEITTPGYLDAEGERRAIRQLADSGAPLVLIVNRPTPEFRESAFGVDYCEHLMEWIERNYDLAAVFGSNDNRYPQIGDRTFFIRAYKRKTMDGPLKPPRS